MFLLSEYPLIAFSYGFFRIKGGYDFSIWQALLIGACIAPTDPIVASAVADSALAVRLVPARLRHTITAGMRVNYYSVHLC